VLAPIPARAGAASPDDVEARSLLVMSLFVGHHFLAVDHGGRSRREVVALALRQLLD
jgi:hypothetical protein